MIGPINFRAARYSPLALVGFCALVLLGCADTLMSQAVSVDTNVTQILPKSKALQYLTAERRFFGVDFTKLLSAPCVLSETTAKAKISETEDFTVDGIRVYELELPYANWTLRTRSAPLLDRDEYEVWGALEISGFFVPPRCVAFAFKRRLDQTNADAAAEVENLVTALVSLGVKYQPN